MRQWTADDKKQLLTDIRVVKRLYAREIAPFEIADMMERDYETVELIIQLLDDGFYGSDLELMEAAIILMNGTV